MTAKEVLEIIDNQKVITKKSDLNDLAILRGLVVGWNDFYSAQPRAYGLEYYKGVQGAFCRFDNLSIGFNSFCRLIVALGLRFTVIKSLVFKLPSENITSLYFQEGEIK